MHVFASMKVRDVMTRDPAMCRPETSLVEAARVMVEHDCGSVPVVGDDRKPIGILTDRDIVARTIARGIDPIGLTVGQCMTFPATTILEDASLDDCVELLEVSQIRRVLVVDAAGVCTGIVSQADVALHGTKRETGELVRELSKRQTPAFAQ